jgi:beta-lactamase class D
MIPIVLSALTFPVPVPVLVAQKPSQKIDFARHFQELGVEGSIVIQSLNTNQTFQHNPQRNATGFLPASTFKILNSLIALETKVMPDEVAVLTWDGIQRQVPEWNRDLNMREAFKRSAVWFYQVLARRVGHEPMQKWVKEAKYGNQKIGPQSDLDKFWLEGELRITPQEQIQFLQRLYGNELPFTARSLSLTKDLMIMEQTPDYTIRAKTGFVGQIGWVVGYVEKGKDVYFFATNIDIKTPKDLPARMALTRRCLKDLGVL